MRANDRVPMPLANRTERVHQQGKHWFFRTREGIDIGGFASAFDAQLAACLLIDRLAQAESVLETRQAMQLFLHAPPIAFTDAGAATAREARPAPSRGRWQIGDSLRRWLEPSTVRAH